LLIFTKQKGQAHYDIFDAYGSVTDGYNDNGSGVATLLELARVIVDSKCKPKNSIIFVAFDLEEMGAQVSISLHFIQ